MFEEQKSIYYDHHNEKDISSLCLSNKLFFWISREYRETGTYLRHNISKNNPCGDNEGYFLWDRVLT